MRALASAGGAKPDAAVELPAPFLAAFRSTLSDASLDPSLRAYALVLPPLSELSQAMAVIDPTNLPAARRAVRRSLALACQQELVALYDTLAPAPGAPFSVDGAEIGRRRLRNCALGYLCSLPDGSPGGRDAVARAKARRLREIAGDCGRLRPPYPYLQANRLPYTLSISPFSPPSPPCPRRSSTPPPAA